MLPSVGAPPLPNHEGGAAEAVEAPPRGFPASAVTLSRGRRKVLLEQEDESRARAGPVVRGIKTAETETETEFEAEAEVDKDCRRSEPPEAKRPRREEEQGVGPSSSSSTHCSPSLHSSSASTLPSTSPEEADSVLLSALIAGFSAGATNATNGGGAAPHDSSSALTSADVQLLLSAFASGALAASASASTGGSTSGGGQVPSAEEEAGKVDRFYRLNGSKDVVQNEHEGHEFNNEKKKKKKLFGTAPSTLEENSRKIPHKKIDSLSSLTTVEEESSMSGRVDRRMSDGDERKIAAVPRETETATKPPGASPIAAARASFCGGGPQQGRAEHSPPVAPAPAQIPQQQGGATLESAVVSMLIQAGALPPMTATSLAAASSLPSSSGGSSPSSVPALPTAFALSSPAGGTAAAAARPSSTRDLSDDPRRNAPVLASSGPGAASGGHRGYNDRPPRSSSLHRHQGGGQHRHHHQGGRPPSPRRHTHHRHHRRARSSPDSSSSSSRPPRFIHRHAHRRHHSDHGHDRNRNRHDSSLHPHRPHHAQQCRRQLLAQRLRRTRKLAAAGDPEAMYELGNMHYRGVPHGVLRRNKRTGYVWFRRSADGGSPRGMAAAGALLVNGAECAEEVDGVSERGSARRGDEGGEGEGEGEGGDHDDSGNARRRIVRASRKRPFGVVGETDDEGSHNNGCGAGRGIQRSASPSSLPLSDSSRQGWQGNDPSAAAGARIRHSPPRAPSLSEGMSLLGAAAASGSALACFWLGQCHLDGTYGLPVNLRRSRMWLSRVVRPGPPGGECRRVPQDLDRNLRTRAREMLEELDWMESEEEQDNATVGLGGRVGVGGTTPRSDGAVSSSSSSGSEGEGEEGEEDKEMDVRSDDSDSSGSESDGSDSEDVGVSDAATVTGGEYAGGGATTDCEEGSK